MEPIVDGLEAEFDDSVSVVRLDANVVENSELQQQFGVQGHPSFVVLDASGAVTARFFGPQTEADLRAALTAVSHSQ